MWREVFLHRWSGVLLGVIVMVAVGWLAVTGQLTLYMHPRYVVFTLVMLGIGAVLAFAAAIMLPGRPVEHDHDHGDAGHEDAAPARPSETSVDLLGLTAGTAPVTTRATAPDAPALARRRTRRQGLALTGSALVAAAALVLLLVFPAATLSADTAAARSVTTSGTVVSSTVDADNLAAGTDYSGLEIADWVSLLGQTTELSFYAGKDPSVLGFVSPDPADPENVFFLSRFMVTCCTVDAQALGLPVYLPGWQRDYEVGQWLQIDGRFQSNPSAETVHPVVVIPDVVEPAEEPADPYVH